MRWLFRRRFDQVWLRQRYRPDSSSRTVYYLNHHSWWDGLIPLLLNEYRFGQRARAMMENRQMRRYPFFSRIGAFSVNRGNPRSALRSLRYAVESMRRPRACLFIYPEGTLTPPGSRMDFEGGLAWLHDRLAREELEVDFVPVALHMHTLRGSRPELHLSVGDAVRPDVPGDAEATGTVFERHWTTCWRSCAARQVSATPLSSAFPER
ncbi:MAG: lysophospholipid acyltransferase family protein [Balneolaceae bacterium]|nr:lysophospholipid acyltransferase family protein [Balneolaceae bacterium]